MANVIENPMAPYPIVERGEYRAVLPAEQTLNYKEVEQYYNAISKPRTLKAGQVDEMLDNLFKQPIMASVYRQHDIKPEQVEEFIETVKQKPETKKMSLIDQFYASYGLAAHSIDGFKKGELSIAGPREWNALEANLRQAATINKEIELFAKAQQPIEKTKTTSEKVQNWVKDAATIATGVVASVLLTVGAQKLFKLTAKDDMKKVEAQQKQLSQQDNNQKTAKMPIKTPKIYE